MFVVPDRFPPCSDWAETVCGAQTSGGSLKQNHYFALKGVRWGCKMPPWHLPMEVFQAGLRDPGVRPRTHQRYPSILSLDIHGSIHCFTPMGNFDCGRKPEYPHTDTRRTCITLRTSGTPKSSWKTGEEHGPSFLWMSYMLSFLQVFSFSLMYCPSAN